MINEEFKKYRNIILNDIKSNCTFEVDCVNNKISHSYLLQCGDNLMREIFGLYFANSIINKENNSNIESKIEKHLHSDVYFLPKNDEKLKVEDANSILESVNIYALEQECKVYILDNFEDATPQMQNKLLKILEEPPQNVYFLLMCANDNKILTPIKSRCKKLFLGNLKDNSINEILENFNIEQSKKDIAKFLGQNNFGRTIDALEKKEYFALFNFCIDFLSNCKNSKELLYYESKLILYKTNLRLFLEIYSQILSELSYHISTNEYKSQNLASYFNKFIDNYELENLIILQENIISYSKSLNVNINVLFLIDKILLDNLQLRKRNK